MSLLNEKQAKALRKAFGAFVPAKLKRTIRKYAKAVVAGVGSVVSLVNAVAPAYSDEAQIVVGIVALAGTILGVRQVTNVDTAALPGYAGSE